MLLKLVLGFYESAFEMLMREVISIGLTWLNRFTSAIHTLAKPHSPAWLEGVLVLARSSSTTAVAKEVLMHKAGASPASRGCGRKLNQAPFVGFKCLNTVNWCKNAVICVILGHKGHIGSKTAYKHINSILRFTNDLVSMRPEVKFLQAKKRKHVKSC